MSKSQPYTRVLDLAERIPDRPDVESVCMPLLTLEPMVMFFGSITSLESKALQVRL